MYEIDHKVKGVGASQQVALTGKRSADYRPIGKPSFFHLAEVAEVLAQQLDVLRKKEK